MDFLGPGVIFMYKCIPHDFFHGSIYHALFYTCNCIIGVWRVIITWGYCGVLLMGKQHKLSKMHRNFFFMYHVFLYLFYIVCGMTCRRSAAKTECVTSTLTRMWTAPLLSVKLCSTNSLRYHVIYPLLIFSIALQLSTVQTIVYSSGLNIYNLYAPCPGGVQQRVRWAWVSYVE